VRRWRDERRPRRLSRDLRRRPSRPRPRLRSRREQRYHGSRRRSETRSRRRRPERRCSRGRPTPSPRPPRSAPPSRGPRGRSGNCARPGRRAGWRQKPRRRSRPSPGRPDEQHPRWLRVPRRLTEWAVRRRRRTTTPHPRAVTHLRNTPRAQALRWHAMSPTERRVSPRRRWVAKPNARRFSPAEPRRPCRRPQRRTGPR
jgi:hypothetical protein